MLQVMRAGNERIFTSILPSTGLISDLSTFKGTCFHESLVLQGLITKLSSSVMALLGFFFSFGLKSGGSVCSSTDETQEVKVLSVK